MHTLQEILEAARRLTAGERKRLVAALEGTKHDRASEEPRRAALASWLALAGRFHSDFTDVSTDKYKHLADVYADRQ